MLQLTFLLLCSALLQPAVFAVSDDDLLLGWHDFLLKVKDVKSADIIRDFAKEKDCLIARENDLSLPKDVLVPPKEVDSFKQLLSEISVEYEIADTDIGSLLLQEKISMAKQRSSDPTVNFVKSDAIYEWMRQLASGNRNLELEKYGTSYEGRDLWVLKFSTNKAANKPIIFVDSTIHAREWLAPSTLCYIIKQMVASPNDAVVQKYDWYFVPVVNPDGYDFSHQSSRNRFWRKTRKPYGWGRYGADPNRNFDYQFGGPGTSNNPSSDTYHGPEPFSEPETKALSVYLTKIRSRVQQGMYLSFHTYGQLWLTPPGYDDKNPSDHAEMMRVANVGKEALRKVNGNNWKVGQPANIGLYKAAGGSYDWAKYVLGVKYSYTFELFPQWPAGIGGFAASPRDIPNSGKEVLAAVKATASALP